VSVVHEFVLEDALGTASKLERWFGRVSGRVGRDRVRVQFPARWCYSCRDGQVVGRGVDSGRAHDPAEVRFLRRSLGLRKQKTESAGWWCVCAC
jgi:hypothetical protein